MEISTSKIVLNYTCNNGEDHESGLPITATQPLGDIVSVGTLVCEECGDDMDLDSEVSILD